jgi:hypothetical protein
MFNTAGPYIYHHLLRSFAHPLYNVIQSLIICLCGYSVCSVAQEKQGDIAVQEM